MIMWQGQWYSSARVAKHTHGETARCAGMRGMSQRSFGAVAVLTARDCRARLEGSSSSAWASVAMARHPVGGGGCGAHRGHGASPPVRSAENVFRLDFPQPPDSRRQSRRYGHWGAEEQLHIDYTPPARPRLSGADRGDRITVRGHSGPATRGRTQNRLSFRPPRHVPI